MRSMHPRSGLAPLGWAPGAAGRPAARRRGRLGRWFAPELPQGTRPRRVTSADGTPLAVVELPGPGADVAVVYAHGFLSGKDHRAVPGFLAALARHFRVYAFDFRGHGESGGRCSFAGGEVDDLAAVVALARGQGARRVLVVGSSMGGGVALRHAAAGGDVDGIVTIGALAGGRPMSRPTTEALLRLCFHGSTSRAVVAWLMGARLGELERGDGSPAELAARVAPTPLLIIHGGLDLLIPPSDARRLHAAAGGASRLELPRLLGHDQPHLRPGTAALIHEWAVGEGLVPSAARP